MEIPLIVIITLIAVIALVGVMVAFALGWNVQTPYLQGSKNLGWLGGLANFFKHTFT